MNNFFDFIKVFIKGDSVSLSVFISFILAALRTVYSGGNFWKMILEGIICSCLTLISISVMRYSGVSDQLVVAAGGLIGFMGVKKISRWINRLISKIIPE